MSAVDPLSVHVPDHLGDVDYEDLILDAPYEDRDPWVLRVAVRRNDQFNSGPRRGTR